MVQRKGAQMRNFLADLNVEQRGAVTHGIKNSGDHRPLLVIAGAGTGKTKTLSYRVAYLILSSINPARILLLVFGRLAAPEMIGRAENIVESAAAHRDRKLRWSGTFHSIGAQLLRRYGRKGI
jgi:DNA helicase-2/ATP-dependent DNA helicase PcrA